MNNSKRFSIVKQMMTGRWWAEEYRSHFADSVKAEFPFAPPGMLQSMGAGLLDAHRSWLNRTVKTWDNEVIAMYPPKRGGDTYITIRLAGGKVCWGGHDGLFRSRHVTLITFEGDQIIRFREWSNPLDWLTAAGRELPVFKVRVTEEQMKSNPQTPAPVRSLEDFDLSPEAAAKRRSDNLNGFTTDSFLASRKRVFHPEHYIHYVRNVPYEMKESYGEDELYLIETWAKLAGGWIERMPDAVLYETANSNVFFVENGNYGMKGWAGNDSFGGYTNRYINYLELDDDGFIVQWDEYMNPIAKFNSINVSLPSFPWLY